MWKSWIMGSTLVGSCLVASPALAEEGADAERSAYVLPSKDVDLQSSLDKILSEPPFKKLVASRSLSVALVDVAVDGQPRFAGVLENEMRYAASLPKIAVMLAVFQAFEEGRLEYTPELKQQLEAMIRRSNNRASSDLIELVGFEAIARVLQDPHYELYDEDRNGGLWVGKDYGGALGYWKRDPIHQLSHGATAKQVARFFVMLDERMLVSPEASDEMKRILGKPAIRHKFVRGLSRFGNALIFRKSGTWKRWHSDAALVERGGKRYVVVALLESPEASGVLSQLVVKLDGIVAPAPK